MKKSRILLLSLSMIVAILNFTGCSDGLTHLVFWDSYYIGVNDLNISRENWYITQAILSIKTRVTLLVSGCRIHSV